MPGLGGRGAGGWGPLVGGQYVVALGTRRVVGGGVGSMRPLLGGSPFAANYPLGVGFCSWPPTTDRLLMAMC